MGHSRQITELLGRTSAGDRAAHDRLWALLYNELKRIAESMILRRRGRLQPTEVVNEAYAQFAARERPGLDAEIAFRRYATQVMKNVIREVARSRAADKRSGKHEHVSLTQFPLSARSAERELIVQDALDRLRSSNPLAAEAVELSEYGGFTNEEIRLALGVGLTKAKQLLNFGRATLKESLLDGRP